MRYLQTLLVIATVLFSAAANAQLDANVVKQMQELSAFKNSLTPAERKMSFQLALLSRAANGQLPATLTPLLSKRLLDANGDAVVEVNGYVTNALLSSAPMQGADKVNGQVPQYAFAAGQVRAHVHPRQLLELAAHSDVKLLSNPGPAFTNAGEVTTQGYVAHSVSKAIALGATGAGVKVGVLSDSASPARVATLIGTGDLPSDVTVLPGEAGDISFSDEGTALMEIVHDMAPDAKLFFATGALGELRFAANIRALRYTYHCDIIIDDLSYFTEPVFQNGPIAQAVKEVTADGALYIAGSGNLGNYTSGTSGTWEGDFLPGPLAGAPILAAEGVPSQLHNFGSAAKRLYSDALTTDADYISLQWSDPFGASTNDYDLYILNEAGNSIVGASLGLQTGTQNPFELAEGPFKASQQIVIVLVSGVPRALHLTAFFQGHLANSTAGNTFGHAASADTFTVGAVYWNAAHTGPKPFVGGAANPIETISSDGPRRLFINSDGTPITPGKVLFNTGGGTIIQKPDAVAADGVSVRTPGFTPFFGTSVSAAHAAGIAALAKSANTSLTNIQLRHILTTTTLDTMAPGVDRDSGYGILMALPSVQAAKTLIRP